MEHMIRELRAKEGITQKELCSGICSQSMLSEIEHGKKCPSVDIVKKLYVRLGLIPAEMGKGVLEFWIEGAYEALVKNDLEKLKNIMKDLNISESNDVLLFFNNFFKANIFLQEGRVTEAEDLLTYVKNFATDVPRLALIYCDIVLVTIKVQRKYSVEESLSRVIAELVTIMQSFPGSIVIERLDVYYQAILLCVKAGYFKKAYDLGKETLIFLSKNNSIRFASEIIVVINDIGMADSNIFKSKNEQVMFAKLLEALQFYVNII